MLAVEIEEGAYKLKRASVGWRGDTHQTNGME